jgi:hypothetical protein
MSSWYTTHYIFGVLHVVVKTQYRAPQNPDLVFQVDTSNVLYTQRYAIIILSTAAHEVVF